MTQQNGIDPGNFRKTFQLTVPFSPDFFGDEGECVPNELGRYNRFGTNVELAFAIDNSDVLYVDVDPENNDGYEFSVSFDGKLSVYDSSEAAPSWKSSKDYLADHAFFPNPVAQKGFYWDPEVSLQGTAFAECTIEQISGTISDRGDFDKMIVRSFFNAVRGAYEQHEESGSITSNEALALMLEDPYIW